MKRVLVLGGYGNFGKRICRQLVARDIPVIVAGRSKARAEKFASELDGRGFGAAIDIHRDLDEALATRKPSVVVHTCGPFQGADYRVAEQCIEAAIPYIDLADGREFVTGIGALDGAAKAASVPVISGASTVPGLSSAVIEEFQDEFSTITSLRFGISPGQKAERGLATTQGILSYVGKPLAPFKSGGKTVYGWQDIHRQDYPGLGKRWMANCEIPDLDLLPERYGIKQIRFSAGLELGLLHLGLWGLSHLVRTGLPLDLSKHATFLLSASNWFDRFGSPDGGMHMILEGQGRDGRAHKREWYIIAKDGFGPFIPTIPAVILADKLHRGKMLSAGAYPCVGLVSLGAYLGALAPYPIEEVRR